MYAKEGVLFLIWNNKQFRNLFHNSNCARLYQPTNSLPCNNNISSGHSPVIELSYEKSCYRLIQSCSIHVNSGSYWYDKTHHSFVYLVVLFQTFHCHRHCSRAERVKNIKFIISNLCFFFNYCTHLYTSMFYCVGYILL